MKYAAEKAVIILSLVFGFGVLVASIVSLYNDFSAGKSFEYLMTDVVFFTFGVVLTGGALRLYKRLVKMSAMSDELFNELVFERLKPVLEEVAYSTVELSEVKAELEKLASKIERLERTEKYGVVGTPYSVAFYMRVIVVSLIYMGIYLFMLNYYMMAYTPYLLILLYLVWWAFITREFNLFSRFEAWLVMGIPVLIVPAMAIVLQTAVGVAPLMGLTFATSLLYAYLYYLYAQELSSESKSGRSEESGGFIRPSGSQPMNKEEEIVSRGNEPNFLLRKTKTFFYEIVRWLRS